MKKCYKCDSPLTEDNKSKEHLLQSALGGKKVSYDLLCEMCNNEIGETIDAEIASQIGHFADILGVNNSTKHKVLKAETEDGNDWSIGSSLKGLYHIKCEIKGYPIDLYGKDERECKKKLRKLLNKNKRTDPELDVDEAVANIQFEDLQASGKLFFNNGRSSNPKEMIVGGSKEYYGAIAKIMLNHYLVNGGSKEYVEDMISFVKDQKGDFVGKIKTVFSDAIVRNLDENEIGHIVHVWSNSYDKLLLGYIELFGIYRYLVLLNSNYEGPEYNFKWAYDLVIKKEYDANVIYEPMKLAKLSKDDISIKMGKLQDRFYQIVERNQSEL